MAIHPVIMCGGVGTRLWPYSRQSYPKQFLDLAGTGRSMLQDTLARIQLADNGAAPILICNAEHRFIVAQQVQALAQRDACIVLEPVGRNTAPAVAVAAIKALQSDKDAVLLVLPADHHVAKPANLNEAIERAVAVAQQGYLVTFGVLPEYAETGYGYIKVSEQQLVEGVHAIAEFKEKPDAERAESYVASGNYRWNSGMFVFRADRFLEEMAKHAPEILSQCQQAVASAETDLDFLRLHEPSFSACPSDSIDYAIMEHAELCAVVDLDAGWSDVGSWEGLWSLKDKDEDDNVLSGDVVALDTKNSYLRSETRLLTTLGVSDLVVVETADVVLVANRHESQQVKLIVNRLAAEQRSESEAHAVTYRPWGSYETICLSERFQVKKIVVSPGQKLSLQMHHHRAEHWIVVKGIAQVSCDDQVFTLNEDQSTYIPIGSKHRLENIGKIPLELIEVQSGSYLGEDDIVRFDDVYGRSASK